MRCGPIATHQDFLRRTPPSEPHVRRTHAALSCFGCSGSLPVDRLPSAGLAIEPAAKKNAGRALDELMRALRALPLPVIGRIAEDRLLLDLRCLEDPSPLLLQLDRLSEALR